MGNSTWRFTPGSEAGWERSHFRLSRLTIRTRRSVLSGRWRISRTTRRRGACCMCSGYRLLSIAAVSVLASGVAWAAELRVCADPNNLPFSNRQQQGFDNQIASLAAKELGRTVSYVWAPERGESFVRKTLLARRCDVLMGIPSNYREAAPTEPYYRSTYVFVSKQARHLKIRSLNDPALRRLRIGVHVISDDA